MSAGFCHLHNHTEYSVLDGACKISEMLEKAREYDMSACAITDHGVLFGAVEFYQQAQKIGVKPIIGCELYVAKGGRTVREGRGGNYNHFLMLCENLEGYHNLCRLSSLGHLEGFYYKPRVDDELIAKYNAGIIATSACLAGEIPESILNDDLDAANASVEKYVSIFGKDRFLIELMDHGMPEQKKVNPILAELAEKHGLTMIATNDSHYLNKDDAEPHEALLCIQTNGMLDDEDHFKFPSDEVYFKSPDEMRELFKEWPEAVANTEKIAERCNVEIPLGQHLIPEYVPPEGKDKLEYLRELVYAGLVDRYGEDRDPLYNERADFELGVIESMGFVDYFLVVWDLINFARQEAIPVGPGRGSGAGSLVAYALKITNIDPIRYQLLFERFLNPERVSMPDFDIDFCYVRREEMIEYSRQKYGEDNVAQIVTFGRMLAKAVVRNVARVMGMPYADADRIAKLIPEELKITLQDAYKREPELKALVDDDPEIGKLWRLATRLEGTIGNCGTHAAGVVICDKPLTDYVALYKASATEGAVATQTEMKCLEEVGLLKMDFLGLRTLTVVHDAVRLIKENHGVDIDIDNVECDDETTYELLRSGKTTGIFQLESSGMRDISKRIGLQSLEEICALVALYRPGPMQFIDTYIENKHHPEKIRYDHALLEPILQETYGIALYQEQVMQIVQALAGFSLGQADIMRRAMGKKKVELMAEQRALFVEGCKNAQNIDAKLADKLFDTIETFAGYGFNKSHSMAYAFVAYQTAYLKANYPAEFMAALLTSESRNLDKIAVYSDECRRIEIDVLPPDVNKSDVDFASSEGAVHFGLRAIKNVGAEPARAIVAERKANGPYADIFDFCGRLDSRAINRRVIENLNKAGAFKETGWNPAQVEAALDDALGEAQVAQRDRDAGQVNLFDMMGADAMAETIHAKPDVPNWAEADILANEKEVLGLYVSSHPLERYAETLRRFGTKGLGELDGLREGLQVIVGGIITEAKQYVTKKGQRMAFLTVETMDGSCEVTVFSDLYAEHADRLVAESILMIPSRVNYRNGSPSLVAEDILSVDRASDKLTKAVHVRLNTLGLHADTVRELAEILGRRPGPCDVYLHCQTSDLNEVTVHATSACTVKPSDELVHEVEELLGDDTLWFSGGNGLPRHNRDGEIVPPQKKPWEKKRA